MRVVRFVFSVLALLVVLAIVAAALFFHLAFTGKNLTLTKALVAQVGKTVEGQATKHVTVEIHLHPAARHVSGTARLQVRAEQNGRSRLYFVLNNGLRVRAAWREEENKHVPLRFYQIALVTVLELGRPLATGDVVQVGLRYEGDPLAGAMGLGSAAMGGDEISLGPGDFWYPTDLQGFFTGDVTVTLPVGLDLVHNGREVMRQVQGNAQRVRWVTSRPVPAMALVAGHFTETARVIQEGRYRVLLGRGIGLDAERILASAAASDALFTTTFGTSGLPGTTIFVSRTLARAFNDGGGLIGIPVSRFSRGDYGVATLAHEIAHNWWGGTVAEKWLEPGTGGEWLVEGFAEFSSWLAVQDQLGEPALVRLREQDFFDPEQTATLKSLSVLDNYLDPATRPIIYGKGAFVTSMLRDRLGDAAFATAARDLITGFRYASATDADVLTVFSSSANEELTKFFNIWVRSDAVLDLALEASEGDAVLRNRGTAASPSSLLLWIFPPDGNPEAQDVTVGSSTPVGDAESLIVDPLLATADMYRSSNVLPRRPNPRTVARSARGELLVVYGEPHPWTPATVEHLDAAGRVLHTWEFHGGLESDPVWTADGTRMLGVQREHGRSERLVVLSATDGSRTSLRWAGPASGTAEATLIARTDRLVRVEGKRTSTLVRWPGCRLSAPLASPDGKLVAYAARKGREMELRVTGIDGQGDRLLFSWAPAEVRWAWAPDSSRLFVVLPGDWDWQLWEIPLGDQAPRALVREAAAMTSPVIAPDGHRLAFVAAAEQDYGRERREVFLMDIQSSSVERFNLESRTGRDVAWLDEGSLVVIVSDPVTPAVPRRRELARLVLPDGQLERFP